jgi:hypothetical protein
MPAPLIMVRTGVAFMREDGIHPWQLVGSGGVRMGADRPAGGAESEPARRQKFSPKRRTLLLETSAELGVRRDRRPGPGSARGSFLCPSGPG